MSAYAILLIVIVYFATILIISFFTGRKADNDAFFIGNRNSKWYIVAFGMIGASLSGVSFISVPGWVGTSQFSYMQMVLGYLFGYAFIANVLMPVYYRLQLTSIYTYLDGRFGNTSYKTGAVFFLVSRTFGAAFRLFLVANVLQISVFNAIGVPFLVTVIITILLIWLYTFKGGIKTIIWTDTLQTLFMLIAIVVSIIAISNELGIHFNELFHTISKSDFSRVFFFEDWKGNDKHFFKQFLGGAFITIVMTGLDQDMMQKNLSCRNIREAKKNMYWFSATLIPVNLLFLGLGALLYIYALKTGLALPERTDDLFPLLATRGHLNSIVTIFFIIGIIAAAYSSADSALTSLTTSFTIDILQLKNVPEKRLTRNRMKVHVMFSVILFIIIYLFRLIQNQSVVSALFTMAGYTYGPLLGMYSFGLFTSYKVKDRWVPVVAIAAPLFSFLLSRYSHILFNGYVFGFELLVVNGLVTFLGMLLIMHKKKSSQP